jgi:hypothetical protein
MVVQAPELVQKPSQQSAHGSAKAQDAGQAVPVPVQVRPQLPEVLQLLPQQTSPSTQVEESLQGQPNPAHPSALAGAGMASERPARASVPSAAMRRSTERRDAVAILLVHQSKRVASKMASLLLSLSVHPHHTVAIGAVKNSTSAGERPRGGYMPASTSHLESTPGRWRPTVRE